LDQEIAEKPGNFSGLPKLAKLSTPPAKTTTIMRGNIAQMMQQAQRMQDNLKRVQDELAVLEVVGQSGGGMVSVTLTGKMETRRVRIDPSALADAEMLEDLVAAAFNDAVGKANEESAKRMSVATAGMPLLPGMKLPGLF
jgi:DNA-binding YbaB/EbfC family protein